MYKRTTLDTVTLITIIVAITWRVIMEHIDAPVWMHCVEWGLIIFMFALVVLHFVFRSKEKKQEKAQDKGN